MANPYWFISQLGPVLTLFLRHLDSLRQTVLTVFKREADTVLLKCLEMSRNA